MNMTEQQALSEIRGFYWRFRALRPYQTARRRWLYRQIKKLRLYLVESGVDPEWVRLYCRFFSRLNPQTARRLDAYAKKIGRPGAFEEPTS
ncbi:hypothetical protein FACS189441_5440 [Betaproteobacteria bacterium]|nr:hypothetical protein FACS189441_5440 [Betaproteobacteria bacterium]